MKKSKLFVFILCIVLSLSSLLVPLPIGSGGYINAAILFMQIFIIFIYHFKLKEFLNYCICTGLLLISNILSSISIRIWAQKNIDGIKALAIHQGMDILGKVMAQAALGMIACFSIGVTVIVLIEYIISFSIRFSKYNKAKKLNTE